MAERAGFVQSRLVTLDPRTPVIVGVGQYNHRADSLDDALEPAALDGAGGTRRERRRRARRPPGRRRRPRGQHHRLALPQRTAVPRRTPGDRRCDARGDGQRRQQPAGPGQPDGARHPDGRRRRGRAGGRRGVPHVHACPQGGGDPRVAEGARRRPAAPDRDRARHEPPRRTRARHRHAGADLPDVRDRTARRCRTHGRRARGVPRQVVVRPQPRRRRQPACLDPRGEDARGDHDGRAEQPDGRAIPTRS